MLPVARSEPAMSTSTRPRVNAAPMNSVGSVPHVSGFRPDETVIATSAAEGDVGAGEERADQHAVPGAVGLLRPGLGGDLGHLLRFPRGHGASRGSYAGSMGGASAGRLPGGWLVHASTRSVRLVGQRAGLRDVRRPAEPAGGTGVRRLARRTARAALAGRRLRHRCPDRGRARLLRARQQVVGVEPSDAFRATPRTRCPTRGRRSAPATPGHCRWPTERSTSWSPGWCSTSCPTGRPHWREMCRVTRPGGTVAVYVWDYAGGMAMHDALLGRGRGSRSRRRGHCTRPPLRRLPAGAAARPVRGRRPARRGGRGRSSSRPCSAASTTTGRRSCRHRHRRRPTS